MTIKDLAEKIDINKELTQLQREELHKKLIGQLVEMEYNLYDISNNILIMGEYCPESYNEWKKLSFIVWYDEKNDRDKLLKFSKGDFVKICATIRSFSRADTCDMDLTTISLIKSSQQIKKEQNDKEDRKLKKDKDDRVKKLNQEKERTTIIIVFTILFIILILLLVPSILAKIVISGIIIYFAKELIQ